MADYLVPKLRNRIIPLTRDCDRAFSLRRKNTSGDPVDWDSEVYILIDHRGKQIRVNGVVDSDLATFRIESEVANQLKTGDTWRVVSQQSGDPSRESALMVGTFERNDGNE